MNTDARLSAPPANEHCTPFQIHTFEVSFGMPVWITSEDQEEFNRLFDRIVTAPWNQPKDGVHWLAGCGSKPSWSATDSLFLGIPIEPGAPVEGETTFNEEIYFMESCAREYINDEEKQSVEKRRASEKPTPSTTPAQDSAAILSACYGFIGAMEVTRKALSAIRSALKKGMTHLRKDLEAALPHLEAAMQKCRLEHTGPAHINSNVRLFDLVRYMRSELHQADLISDDEYFWLCAESEHATSPEGGSPSRQRLEDYDELRNQLTEAQNKAAAWRTHIKTCLSYPRGSEAQARCLEEIGQDAAYIDSKKPASAPAPANNRQQA